MSFNKLREKFTYEDVRSAFCYDSHSGVVSRKSDGGLGYINKHGHITFSLNRKLIYAHHIAWWIYYGSPPDVVDHIDMNPTNNKICNLRAADKRGNSCNRGARSDNTSGFKGVSFSKSKGKWRAYCDSKHIGYYATKEEAAQAYNQVANIKHGEFFRPNILLSPCVVKMPKRNSEGQ